MPLPWWPAGSHCPPPSVSLIYSVKQINKHVVLFQMARVTQEYMFHVCTAELICSDHLQSKNFQICHEIFVRADKDQHEQLMDKNPSKQTAK